MAVLVALAMVAAGGLIFLGATGGRPANQAPSVAARPPGRSGPPAGAPRTPATRPDPGTVPAVSSASTVVSVADGSRRFTAGVFFPAVGSGAAAAPLRQGGPWPLVVFSPGFDIDPLAYSGLLEAWSAAGFVVAEPDYPFTAEGAPGGVDEADIVYHPEDLRAVIGEVAAASRQPGGVLSGMVDTSRIGVAGHSDGGDVSDAVVSNTCCRIPAIRAAAVLSGAELASFGGAYISTPVPMLVVQGDADGINVPACSEQIYDRAGSPRLYLDLRGAGHLPPYLDGAPAEASGAASAAYHADVVRTTLLFWEAYLKGDAAALRSLGTGLGEAAAFISGVPIPRQGSCPGAPYP